MTPSYGYGTTSPPTSSTPGTQEMGFRIGIVLRSLLSPAATKSELRVSAYTRGTAGAVYRLHRWVAGVNAREAAGVGPPGKARLSKSQPC